MPSGPRTTRPRRSKRSKTPLTFNLDDQTLKLLRERSASTGLTPGVIVQAALDHVFLKKQDRWLPPGPKSAAKAMRTLRQNPAKSFRWIAAYLERRGFVTSEGSSAWLGSTVQYYLGKYSRNK
jgi:hypothetical protein